ncbi:MAG: hypothetical protein GWO20_10055 [Candidatus Korarchaeota archaeon]|nr:hypothetical protein [Candidatus Korarchaeota archaeon]NIU83855.1 hypothetical protein [Candidatus Thorarchaeota archaeon]NIW15431.1 hypothetical protein [Candidatus Thorarchaeota archaeon]NIW53378.1 hypothetical protein [Candidatus Korarchaeota archaeon]
MPGKKTFYFERPGPVNTKKTLQLGIQRALDLGIEHLIVPSLTGRTALYVAGRVRNNNFELPLEVVCVTFRAGGALSIDGDPPGRHWKEIPELKDRWKMWRKMGVKQLTFDERIEDRLRKWEVPIVRATDLGADVETSMKSDLGMSTLKDILKETLYLLCPGVKVSVFSTLMAADAGEIPVGREVIAFGGTEQGIDTAVVIKPSYSDSMFNKKGGLEVRELICKPRSMMGSSGFYYGRAWK